MPFEKDENILGRRVPPAFASDHDGYQKGLGDVRACNAPQRVRELDGLAAQLRTQLTKVREAGNRLAEMRGRVFGELASGESDKSGPTGEGPDRASLYVLQHLLAQMDAETEELLGQIGRMEDLA